MIVKMGTGKTFPVSRTYAKVIRRKVVWIYNSSNRVFAMPGYSGIFVL
jgi:hypothetical protein